jgi:uncharacterized protein
MRKPRLRAAAIALFIASSAFALDTTKLKPTGYVNDFAHALDARSAQVLEAYCASVERATGAQFAVVTVDSLEGDSIDDVANKLYRQWGVGKKGTDEGLLMMLAIKDHKQRVEVGYGLEGTIPDGYAGGVMRGIRPILRQGNYGGAMLAAIQQFGGRVADAKGVALEDVPRPRGAARPSPGIPFPLIIFGIVILIAIVRFLSGGGGGYYGGGGGSGISGFLTGMLLGNLMGRRGGWGGGGWGGGGFGGGDSGGGGFGGFGGGDSGGGGASGDW